MLTLSRDLPVPLYHQVKASILSGIETGQWRPGDRLPSEDELADRYKVSKITVRQALRELAQLGHIRREQGRGTFVQRPPLVEGPRQLTSFSEEMRRQGVQALSEVLDQGIVPASADVASTLGIPEDEPVFRLRRLRLADGDPMGVQTAYMPSALVPRIEDIEFSRSSLYDVLSGHYNLVPASAHETHYAFAVGADDAALLRIKEGDPVMGTELVARLADGRALEYVKSVMRADRYKIVLDLVRQPSQRP
jgi:GntR family transcriptional regulator